MNNNFIDLETQQFEILKTEYHSTMIKDFCLKYNTNAYTSLKLFWRKKTKRVYTVKYKTQKDYQNVINKKYITDLDLLFEQVMLKFNIKKSIVKELLNEYTFSEILASDNIDNIKTIYYIK